MKKLIALLVLNFSVVLWAGGQSSSAQNSGENGKTDFTFAISIRTLQNPYQANYKVGADLYSQKVHAQDAVVLTSEGSSEKMLSDVRALVARTQGKMVLFADPNEAPDALPLAKTLEEAGVYFVTWWNKPEQVKVSDYPHWVAHISYDGIGAGEFTAEELIKSINGQGKIIVLQGLLANSSARERYQGLMNVLQRYPDVQLVAEEAADWDRNKGYEKTLSMLAAHPDTAAVWAANDNMALGAIEALRSKDLAGKVMVSGVDGVPEMFEAIEAGEAVATVMNDAKYQASLGLALAYAAANGTLDVSQLPLSQRQWYAQAVEVNRDNLQEIISDYVDSTPEYNWDDLFSAWVRTME